MVQEAYCECINGSSEQILIYIYLHVYVTTISLKLFEKYRLHRKPHANHKQVSRQSANIMILLGLLREGKIREQ